MIHSASNAVTKPDNAVIGDNRVVEHVSCREGKYTVVFYADGWSTAFRYGEPWPAYHGGCNNLEQALARDLIVARDLIAERERVAALEQELARYKRYGKKSK